MSIRKCVTYLTLVSFIVSPGCARLGGSSHPDPVVVASDAVPTPGRFFEDFGTLTPNRIVAILESRSAPGPLSYRERFDLGSAYLLIQQWPKAADAYEQAAAIANNDRQRAAGLYCAAQAWGLANEWDNAGKNANRATAYAPKSRELAAARWAVWDKAGNRREVEAAQNHLSQLDVRDVRSREVFDPITGVIVVCIFAGAVTAYWIHENPKGAQPGEILKAMVAVAATIAATASAPAAN